MSDFQFRLWVNLITFVDDYGRGLADPDIIKGFCFPKSKTIKASAIDKALTGLVGLGAIVTYIVDGTEYLCFPNWDEHQRIRTKKSKHPPVEEAEMTTRSNLPQSAAECCLKPNQTKPKRNQKETEVVKSIYEDDFEKFWESYPRKVKKQEAFRAYHKALEAHPQVQPSTLLEAVERQKRSKQWNEEGGKYIPHPTTWLNQARWWDELGELNERDNKQTDDANARWGIHIDN